MENKSPPKPKLLCNVCGKESASGPSLKRHMRYCIRKGAISRSRKKSCQHCAQAKARCEVSGRGCLRCSGKGLACSLTVPISSDTNAGMDFWDDIALDPGNLTTLDMNSVPFQDNPSSNAPDSHFPFDLFMPSSVLLGPGPEGEVGNDQRFGLIDPPSNYGQAQAPRLFEPRLFHAPGAIMASTMGTGILKSYPSMMRNRNGLPPFIHPFCYGSERNGWKFPLSLERASFIASSPVDNSPDTLSNIREEQQRIDQTLLEMGIEDLISSGQALIIYILMRIESGPSELDEDVHLYATLSRLCFRIPSLPGFYEKMAEFSPWKQWIIVESKRRLNSTLRLMSQLYNLDVAPNPCNLFTAMPLPASKLLWKASSEQGWETEIARDDFYKKLSLQDLMKFKGKGESGQPSREEWSRWYSGTDELGILVVISASLL
ncbi:unnamed protein product [Clonostachys byssicola]|uniref:Zn(2)-C6 fungal-type domain-containing protein n=1 Tax=Clonostachys byssicola TaxID=160290 RepID=A0A9N9UX49_9HYPO|nr:unnamed protein product [Clonostachys byssicola]